MSLNAKRPKVPLVFGEILVKRVITVSKFYVSIHCGLIFDVKLMSLKVLNENLLMCLDLKFKAFLERKNADNGRKSFLFSKLQFIVAYIKLCKNCVVVSRTTQTEKS